MLACFTLYKSNPAIPGNPIGKASERNGWGGVTPACCTFAAMAAGNLRFLAAEHVPHGGAKCIKHMLWASCLMKSSKNFMSSSTVKSKMVSGPFARSRLRSIATPLRFAFRTSTVRTDVPAKTSRKRMFSNSCFRFGGSGSSHVKAGPPSCFEVLGGVKTSAQSVSLGRPSVCGDTSLSGSSWCAPCQCGDFFPGAALQF